MKIRHKLYLGFGCIILLMGLMGVASLLHLFKVKEPLQKDIPETLAAVQRSSRLDILAQKIRYYDEVLTQSVRNFAFTRKRRWRERYQEAEPELEAAIKKAVELGEVQDRAFFSNIERANRVLVKMERESVKLVERGRSEQALDILESAEYRNQKSIYRNGLVNYTRKSDRRLDESLGVCTEEVESANAGAGHLVKEEYILLSGIFVTALLLAIVTSVGITRSLSNSIGKLTQAVDEIGSGHPAPTIESDSTDETGRLAEAFNHMSRNLARTTTSIDKLNAVNQRLQSEISERKRTEQKYRSLFESSRDAIMTLEPPVWKFTSGNAAALKLFGVKSQADFCSATLWDLSPGTQPDGRLSEEKAREMIEKAMRGGSNFFEWTYKRVDGSEFQASVLLSRMELNGRLLLQAMVRDITERWQAEKVKEDLLHDLAERCKELKLLYKVSELSTKIDISADDIIRQTVELIPNAWHYPEITSARIILEGKEYKTDNFKKTKWCQCADIRIYGKKAGVVEVCYLEEMCELYEGPFLKEERDLINTFSRLTGSIIERKQAEEELRESEEKYRNLAENLNELIYRAGPDACGATYVNKAVERFYGYSKEEWLAKPSLWEECIHPDDRTRVVDEFEQAYKQGKITSMEYRIIRRDGSIRHVVDSVFPERDNKGNLKSMNGVMYDITERSQGQKKLKEHRGFLDNIVENIPDMVFVKDAEDLKFVRLNKFGERLLGYSREQMYGKTDYDFFPKEQADRFTEKDREALKEGKLIDIPEESIRTSSGQRILHTKKIPLLDEQEISRYLLAISQDITERKGAEQKQAELLKELENVNAELKDFAYIVSHDLKAPLRGIKTLTEWIREDYADKLDDQGREELELLSNRAQRMHNLIDGILEYSRVGRVKEKLVQVNLSNLLPEIIDMVCPGENISVEIENELPVIECEKTRIMQVFQNILSNAVKYIDKPQGQIRIGCMQEDGLWKFYVSDNGPGIKQKDSDRIFKIFQKGASEDAESTGVGLTVVKKIIEMYGGRIWVESQTGQGSTFLFTFPKAKARIENEEFQSNITG